MFPTVVFPPEPTRNRRTYAAAWPGVNTQRVRPNARCEAQQWRGLKLLTLLRICWVCMSRVCFVAETETTRLMWMCLRLGRFHVQRPRNRCGNVRGRKKIHGRLHETLVKLQQVSNLPKTTCAQGSEQSCAQGSFMRQSGICM
jgi:hypothetical protein